MSAAVGCGSVSGSWAQVKDRINNLGNRNCRNKNGFKVSCVLSSSAVSDSYRTLRIRPGASESEVKKAFRKLALQYHPDVCKEGNCGEQFHQIYEAYDFVMSHLRDVENDNVVGLNESKGDMFDVYDDWEDEMGGYEAGANYSSYYSPFYSYA